MSKHIAKYEGPNGQVDSNGNEQGIQVDASRAFARSYTRRADGTVEYSRWSRIAGPLATLADVTGFRVL